MIFFQMKVRVMGISLYFHIKLSRTNSASKKEVEINIVIYSLFIILYRQMLGSEIRYEQFSGALNNKK